ncbi:hypothetical protein V6N13_033324 [Hibiscus sabdariffa]
MVTNDGLWDWDRIGSSLPRIALDRIASVPPPRAGTFVTTDDVWPHRFAIICWLLWKRRCRLLLEEDVGVLDDVLVTGNCLLMQTKDAFTMLVGSNARNAVARTWCRPQLGRDMNKVADSLAQRGRELGAGSSAFYLPPEGTTTLVIQEQGASGAVPGMHARGAPVISGAAVGIG